MPGAKRDVALGELLKRLEVPDCDCPKYRIECVTDDQPAGCAERRKSGKCNCPNVYALACPHLRGMNAAALDAVLDEWLPRLAHLLKIERHHCKNDVRAMVWGLLCQGYSPTEYAEPPDPPAPSTPALEREARVRRMRTRRHREVGFRHSGDQPPETLKVSVQMGKGRRELDLTIPEGIGDDEP